MGNGVADTNDTRNTVLVSLFHPRGQGSLLTPSDHSPRLRRVLTEIEALFLHEGFLHLSTADVVQRLKCSKTSLYRLAPSREALFQLVVERFLARIRSEGRAAAERTHDWYDAITAFLGAAVPVTRPASYEFFRDMRRFPATSEQLRRHQHQRMLDLEQLIQAGIRDGAFRGLPPRLLAELLFATVGRLTEPEVIQAIGVPMSVAVEEAYRIFEYGVIPRNGSRPRASKKKDLKLAEVWPADETRL